IRSANSSAPLGTSDTRPRGIDTTSLSTAACVVHQNQRPGGMKDAIARAAAAYRYFAGHGRVSRLIEYANKGQIKGAAKLMWGPSGRGKHPTNPARPNAAHI